MLKMYEHMATFSEYTYSADGAKLTKLPSKTTIAFAFPTMALTMAITGLLWKYVQLQ